MKSYSTNNSESALEELTKQYIEEEISFDEFQSRLGGAIEHTKRWEGRRPGVSGNVSGDHERARYVRTEEGCRFSLGEELLFWTEELAGIALLLLLIALPIVVAWNLADVFSNNSQLSAAAALASSDGATHNGCNVAKAKYDFYYFVGSYRNYSVQAVSTHGGCEVHAHQTMSLSLFGLPPHITLSASSWTPNTPK
jgi:hypothetical protein